MDSWFDTIAEKLFKMLWPRLEKLFLEKLWPKLQQLISNKLDEWLPKIMKAAVVGVSQAAGQLAVNTTDKITDIIPTDLDDRIIDPIVQQGMDYLHKTFGF